MQTASTNICERMGRSQELSEFKHGTVIGWHLSNKSICEMSLLLNIPRSTISGIKTEWKRRMQRCKASCHWILEQWRHVLWRDESHFSVWQSDGCVWDWQLPEEQYMPDCIVPSV
ncbi:unnamed protein product, partial [Staurois parvus]